MIGGVVVGAGPANRTVIWESVNAGHSPVMNKMALRPCHFKSAMAPPWLQLWLSQMTNTTSTDEGHPASADDRQNIHLALKWHSSATFEQFARSSYSVHQ